MVQQLGGGEEERDQGWKRLLVLLERPKGRLRGAQDSLAFVFS